MPACEKEEKKTEGEEHSRAGCWLPLKTNRQQRKVHRNPMSSRRRNRLKKGKEAEKDLREGGRGSLRTKGYTFEGGTFNPRAKSVLDVGIA